MLEILLFLMALSAIGAVVFLLMASYRVSKGLKNHMDELEQGIPVSETFQTNERNIDFDLFCIRWFLIFAAAFTVQLLILVIFKFITALS